LRGLLQDGRTWFVFDTNTRLVWRKLLYMDIRQK